MHATRIERTDADHWMAQQVGLRDRDFLGAVGTDAVCRCEPFMCRLCAGAPLQSALVNLSLEDTERARVLHFVVCDLNSHSVVKNYDMKLRVIKWNRSLRSGRLVAQIEQT